MGTRSLPYDPERMRTRFRPYDPDQQLLLPQDLREWVPAGHLAHHVSDLVDAADLSPFYARYEGDGRRRSPYDPRMMVKVLVYGYATGVFSSRKLARRLEEDVALRMLAAGNFPAHRTLCEFRKKNLKAFGALFAEVVRLARELGLAGLGRVAVDGTKVRANASKRKAMSYGRMGPEEARLEAEIADLLAAAEAIDAEEDERHGEDVRGDELPEELKRREDRLAAIRAAKARLEAEARERDDAYGEPEAKDQTNFTDPESRIMRTSTEGYQQCYNARAVVDGESQLVVGTAVTDNASDQGQLVERVDEVSGRCGETPGQVLADAGYCNEEDLAALEARGIDGYVALGREGKGAGKPDPEKQPARARMAKKLAAPEGRAVYAKRKWIAEAPMGWVKEAMGFRRFSLRGLEKVRGEWDLVCLALNMRRLHVLQAA